MGHYASEMISDDEYQEKAERIEKQRNNVASKIKEAIDEEGIEYVLADIVLNNHIRFI